MLLADGIIQNLKKSTVRVWMRGHRVCVTATPLFSLLCGVPLSALQCILPVTSVWAASFFLNMLLQTFLDKSPGIQYARVF